MKLVVVGTGYVGLVSALCFAEFGFDTICVDSNEERLGNLRKLKSPFFEPGIDDLLVKHIKETKRVTLSNSISESVINADIVFITVGTPSKRLEDEADLSAVYRVAEEVSNNINHYCIIVTKSTVPVGTTRKIKEIILKKVSKDKFDVVSNPEFLREGSAINDFMRPDRVVIGTESKKSIEIMREVYRPLYLQETPIVFTTIESAEIIKYASNSFLATKITYINQVANLCEAVGADIQDVAKAMGIDKRIGSKFLHAGPGYGGSCFPKDIKAFSVTADKLGVDFSIIKAVNLFNQDRPKQIAKRIKDYFKNNVENIIISVLGLSFKPNTDDVRDSTSIIIIKELINSGAKIQCFDPQAMLKAEKILPNINYCNSAYEAINNANALIIATEWNEFKTLDLNKIKKNMRDAVIFDLRNIYNMDEVKNLGFKYHGIGK